MVVSGLVIVNVSYSYLEHFTFEYYLSAAIGMGLTIAGTFIQFVTILKFIKEVN